MIKSWKHKGLRELFETGSSRRVRADLHKRAFKRLSALDAATKPEDLNVMGFNFHGLVGVDRYSIHVNGPICITFAWDDGATDVDLENYH